MIPRRASQNLDPPGGSVTQHSPWIEKTNFSKCNIFIGIGYKWSLYSEIEGSEEYMGTVQNELFAITIESLGYDLFWH
jgi:hypothetical protein